MKRGTEGDIPRLTCEKGQRRKALGLRLEAKRIGNWECGRRKEKKITFIRG